MASQRREVTLLVLPPNEMATWRLRVPVRWLIAGFAAWTILTLWGGVMFARSADYWAIKADNSLMRLKMATLSDEVVRSKESVERAADADQKLRELLKLPNARAMAEKAPEAQTLVAQTKGGSGGPLPLDRFDLLAHLKQAPPEDIESVRLRAELVREQSDRTLSSIQEVLGYLGRQRATLRATPVGWPAPGRITSSFGVRVSPIDGEEGEFHPGLDIANSLGTPIIATADGVVRQAGWSRGYGRVVIIDHGRGRQTLVGHASELLVARGQKVRRGDIVARMGSTGRSTGSHVHYEVWLNGRPVNPMRYLREPDLKAVSAAAR